MSDASDKGKKLEQEIAGIIRKKTGKHAARDSRSGANWHRRSDVFTELPIHIEAKDHATIKVKEWYRQAKGAAGIAELPVLAFRCDEQILATVEFSKLIDLYVELAQLRAENDDLRQPIQDVIPPKVNNKMVAELKPLVSKKAQHGAMLCAAGHLADDWGYCMQLGCPFSRGYKAKKVKKK